MKIFKVPLIVVAIILSCVTFSYTDVLDFENVPGANTNNYSLIPNGYGGFNWSQTYIMHKDYMLTHYGTDTGYYAGIVSGDWIAFMTVGTNSYITITSPAI